MYWHKCIKGMPFHPQWRLIGDACGEEVSRVVYVFSTLADAATQDHDEGSIEGWRADEVATYCGIPQASVEAIFEAMRGRVHDGGRLINWEKHQAAPRDRTGAERQARHRARQADKPAIPSDEVDVTRYVTQSRVEESREEKNHHTGLAHDALGREDSNLRVPDDKALAELRGLLVAAAGSSIDLASPTLMDLSPILGLMGPGRGPPCDLQRHVLPAIRAKAPTVRPGRVFSWAFYAGPIIDYRDACETGAPPLTPKNMETGYARPGGSRSAAARDARREGIAHVVELELAQARRAEA